MPSPPKGSRRSRSKKQLTQAKSESEREVEELRRQLDELRRIADSKRAEKDQLAMRYEANKLDSGGVASEVLEVLKRRAAATQSVSERLRLDDEALRRELAELQQRVVEAELRTVEQSGELVSLG